jgi:hypothetical protein
MRRASALLTQYAIGDVAGVAAIWQETAEADAWPDLAGAVVALFFELSPELRKAKGQKALRELTRSWAAAEAADPPDSDGDE